MEGSCTQNIHDIKGETMNPLQALQFITITKHMNMTKASEELFISQSALSQSLGRLEKELNVRLFYRDGNRLVLSREGEVLKPYFEEYLEAHDRILNMARDLTTTKQDLVRIGYSGSALQFSALYINDYFSRLSDLQVTLTYAETDSLESMLLGEEIDIAISYPPIQNYRITSIPLHTENIVLAVPSHHPLARYDELSFKDLEGYEFIGSTAANHFRRLFDQLCARHGYHPEYHAQLDFNDLYQMNADNAYDGEYITFTPENCFDGTFGEGYKKIRFKEKGMSYVTAISWLSAGNAEIKYQKLISYIRSTYTEQEAFHAHYVGQLSKNLIQ